MCPACGSPVRGDRPQALFVCSPPPRYFEADAKRCKVTKQSVFGDLGVSVSDHLWLPTRFLTRFF